ncbi:MAG: hypothetical protein HFE80_08330 [Clostridiaceae bacterium]|jgi:hypothetical protein|nr:hypothetical protein [Clostridiaceae bacterium]
MRKTKEELTHNARIKRYPDGSWTLLVASRGIFGLAGWEDAEDWGDLPEEPEKGTENNPAASRREPAAADRKRSARRARARVFDLAMCSDLDYFVTLTLDPARIDRFDMAALIRRMRSWLDNRVRRKGLAYILVPELHQDGAIHLHGLINNALQIVDSGVKHSRQGPQGPEWYDVYNLPDWKLGFSTAIQLHGDRKKAVNYVCKYITKCAEKGKIGGRFYYSGGDLREPETEYLDAPWFGPSRPDYEFDVKSAGLAFRVFSGRDWAD